MGSSKKPEVIKILEPFYHQGRKLLTADGNRLLTLLRSDLLLKLRQQGTLGKLRITVLKSYAKRLGFDMVKRISRRKLERSLEVLMDVGLTGINMIPSSYNSSMVTEPDSKIDVTKSDVGTLVENTEGLTLNCPREIHKVAVSDEKNVTTAGVNAQSMLSGNASGSRAQSVRHRANKNANATLICKISKEYNLHVTGSLILPDGNRYDRIFNVGGGNCYFYAVCQGLEFFGISIDHVHLRTNVGRWLQNPHNAQLMYTHLEIMPPGLYHHLKRFPPPPGGWASYLTGMTWQDWGAHVELLGEWVGPMELTPTNHVLQEMGTDIRVNIFDPRSGQIIGDEENKRSDGIDKPIIMVLSLSGHYEWLRLRND